MGRDGGDGPEAEESRLLDQEEENLLGGMGVTGVQGVGYAPGEVGGLAQRGSLNAPPLSGPRPPALRSSPRTMSTRPSTKRPWTRDATR
jgi:hypothetical protein